MPTGGWWNHGLLGRGRRQEAGGEGERGGEGGRRGRGALKED